MITFHDKIQSAVDDFKNQIQSIATDEAIAVLQGLRPHPVVPAPPTFEEVRPSPPPTNGTAAPHGVKRPPDEINKLTVEVGKYIIAHPGQGVEVIAKALGRTTHELEVPVRRLINTKEVRTTGAKRATRYWPITSARKK